MGPESEHCQEHSGLVESIKLLVTSVDKSTTENTANANRIYDKLNDACIKLAEAGVQVKQNVKDIDGLGLSKESKDAVKVLVKEISFFKKVFYGSICGSIFVGIIIIIIQGR